MTRVMTAAVRGSIDVIRSPWLVAGALLVTLAAAAPFAVIVGNRLQQALAHEPPIALGSGEIDADWWSEFRAHAEGLAATFTPTVIGFAAPLDNLSALLDATRRPLSLLAPIAAAVIVWAWFWGVALTRFHRPHRRSMRDTVAAGFAHLPRFLIISLAAAAVQLILYLTVHPLLFRVAYQGLADGMSEPAAFAVRVAFYLVFGVLLATVSLAADYSRIIQVVDRPPSVGATIARGTGIVRRHYGVVLALFAATGLLFGLLLAAYGGIEIYGGARVGGWRGVALAQLYIIGRLVIRLTSAASELRLLAALRT